MNTDSIRTLTHNIQLSNALAKRAQTNGDFQKAIEQLKISEEELKLLYEIVSDKELLDVIEYTQGKIEKLNNKLLLEEKQTKDNNITPENLKIYNELLEKGGFLMHRAALCKENGKTDDAIRNYTSAAAVLEEAEKINVTNRVLDLIDTCYLMAFQIALEEDDLEDADRYMENKIKYNRKQYELDDDIETKSYLARSLFKTGVLKHKIEENRKALEYYNEALKYSKELAEELNTYEVFSDLSDIYFRMLEITDSTDREAIDFYTKELIDIYVIMVSQFDEVTSEDLRILEMLKLTVED